MNACAYPGCKDWVTGPADDCCEAHDWCARCEAPAEWRGDTCAECGYVWGGDV